MCTCKITPLYCVFCEYGRLTTPWLCMQNHYHRAESSPVSIYLQERKVHPWCHTIQSGKGVTNLTYITVGGCECVYKQYGLEERWKLKPNLLDYLTQHSVSNSSQADGSGSPQEAYGHLVCLQHVALTGMLHANMGA